MVNPNNLDKSGGKQPKDEKKVSNIRDMNVFLLLIKVVTNLFMVAFMLTVSLLGMIGFFILSAAKTLIGKSAVTTKKDVK
jgi:hypothetical protein